MKQQPGDNRCLSMVASLITGETPEAFEDYARSVGGPPSPPYDELHLYRYLLDKGWLAGHVFSRSEVGAKLPITAQAVINQHVTLGGVKAYAIVKSDLNPLGLHAIYWDGTQIHDPAPHVKRRRHWNNYWVYSITPLQKLR